MSTEMINEKEIHISVDPVSMKEVVEYPTSRAIPKPPTANNKPGTLPSAPKKNKFLSASLPSSACSSPRAKTKVVIDDDQGGLEKGSANLAHQHSVALSRLAWLRENRMQRSKSCGEGRPSVQYDEFDLYQSTSSKSTSAESTPRGQTSSSDDDVYRGMIKSSAKKKISPNEDDFKCGALCLFLPRGFGSKAKPVRSKRDQREEIGHVISQRVSLEKFECGSWRSSGILTGGSDFSSNMYFDLPLELIQTSGNDANLPVNSAFLFDKDVKGVLKTNKGSGESRKSHDARHVRFSTSSSPVTSPTSASSCITPRMRKARDEFNSFLEAQNA